MNEHTYIYLFILCLITLVAIPVALTKKLLSKSIRALIVLCPIIYGGIYFLITKDNSAVYIMLMAVMTLLAVVFHPGQEKEKEKEVEE